MRAKIREIRRAPGSPSGSVAEKTVNEVRDLALLLRPSMLDDLGLVPALKWHGREMTKRTGLKSLSRPTTPVDHLPDEHTLASIALVQEALNNAVRHATLAPSRSW